MLRLMLVLALAVLGLCTDAAPTRADQPGAYGEPVTFQDKYVEQLWRFPMVPPKQKEKLLLLDGIVFKPGGDGPFKTVVMNHGSPRKAEDRRQNGRRRYELVADFFLKRGFAVVVPMRRGYGSSEGEYSEGYGQYSDPDYYTAGLSSANDITAVVKYLRELPFVDKDHIVLMGQSAGGWGVAAASARNLPGVVAGVIVGGGRGSLDSDTNLLPDKLFEAARRYGVGVKIPTLWLYSANDHYFPPAVSRQVFDAFLAGGSAARYELLDNIGNEGHELLRVPYYVDVWAKPVEEFLRSVGEM